MTRANVDQPTYRESDRERNNSKTDRSIPIPILERVPHLLLELALALLHRPLHKRLQHLVHRHRRIRRLRDVHLARARRPCRRRRLVNQQDRANFLELPDLTNEAVKDHDLRLERDEVGARLVPGRRRNVARGEKEGASSADPAAATVTGEGGREGRVWCGTGHGEAKGAHQVVREEVAYLWRLFDWGRSGRVADPAEGSRGLRPTLKKDVRPGT
jgi:hypothetical protein